MGRVASLPGERSREHRVVLPACVYERDGARRFNSIATIERDGSVVGLYR